MVLSLSASSRDGFTVVTAVGDVDLKTAPELRDVVEEQIAAGATALVIDLDGVDFLDSSALGTLVGIDKRLGQGELWLVCSRPALLRLLEITRLTDALRVVASVDEIRR